MWLVYMCKVFITTTLLLLFQQGLPQQYCFGCLVEERMALLELKAHWLYNISNPPYLESWNSKDKDSECCGWEGVECTNTTGRVTKLNLAYTRLYFDGQRLPPPLYLNASLFLPFQELNTLSLTESVLFGTIKDGGFERLSTLTNLANLDLSINGLNDSILPSVSTLSSLISLDLHSNFIQTWNDEDLKILNKLESLDLSYNLLDAEILNSVDKLSRLKHLDLSGMNGSLVSNNISWDLKMLNKLESLDLSNNFLDAKILNSVDKLSRLKHLDLTGNGMNGLFVSNNISWGLCKLKGLEVLNLAANNLDGTLPSCLENLTSLRVLDLSYNSFVGNIASSPLVNIVSLQKLDLSNNQFKSLSPFSSFANHSKLLSFSLDNSDTNELELETEYPTNWIPTFQLQEFHLSHCTININYKMMSGMIPNFLYHQMDLIKLEISITNLQGKFPSWLLRNNTRLGSLKLRNNLLIGPFDLDSKNLVELDVSNNHIHGHLPMNIGTSFPYLRILNISNNFFHGNIPSSIGNISLLWYLDLSNNNLSREIPENLARGCASLIYLSLSNNQLHGQISPSIFNKTHLYYLYLDGNHFTGMNIPQSLSLSLSSINAFNDLQVLDVRDNIISWLPNWLGNMSMLRELYMSKNYIQGPIPETFCNLQMIVVLDLSNNNLIGPIPPCFSPPSIKFIILRRNGLTGSFKNNDNNAFMKNSSKLMVLDLGDNKISGGISSTINGSFLKLHILILKGNHFQGLIPKQLCHLYQISMMDLSFNYLFGQIPSCLANLTFEMTETAYDLQRVFAVVPIFSKAKKEYVEFTTKKRNEIYQEEYLSYASGIDLSSNQLTGMIPHEIGNLSKIHTLNLSHNFLTGTIPSTFSKLDSIESLDLSYNNLSGSIPLELAQLTSLAVFSVAHNSLSGTTPDRKAQFATFDESSYEGNPFLCGPPLNKSCDNSNHSVTTSTPLEDKEKDSSSINFVVFIASFVASFVMGFIAVIVILYINPYWRRMWFHMVDNWICSIDYFLLVLYYKLKHLVHA